MANPALLEILFGTNNQQPKPEGPLGDVPMTEDVSERRAPLQGPGGSRDDLITAIIEPGEEGGEFTPARLSPGEFVIPKDVVDEIGEGDNELGGRQLQTLIDKIRELSKNKKRGEKNGDRSSRS